MSDGMDGRSASAPADLAGTTTGVPAVTDALLATP